MNYSGTINYRLFGSINFCLKKIWGLDLILSWGVLEIWIRETETVRLGTKMGIFIPGNQFENERENNNATGLRLGCST